ncbi:hypothetical protein BGZ95_009953 [Linnemannia exigua]|uniref:Uncharacterized protein n=1 Tax=Linnemannia exigua TaxID=604196 RepID=A0AAD4DC32_9FUNG|nr:hypothetical protein BGZ95_009953 [Linnemannia exigua]
MSKAAFKELVNGFKRAQLTKFPTKESTLSKTDDLRLDMQKCIEIDGVVYHKLYVQVNSAAKHKDLVALREGDIVLAVVHAIYNADPDAVWKAIIDSNYEGLALGTKLNKFCAAKHYHMHLESRHNRSTLSIVNAGYTLTAAVMNLQQRVSIC